MDVFSVPYIRWSDDLLSVNQPVLPVQPIAEQSWPSFPYKPKVAFSMAHTGDHIVVNFQVEEDEVRHVNTAINSPVWEDSCVEFFLALDDTGYYNFEFNCIGTALVGFGKDRNDRKLLPVTVVKRIQCFTAMRQNEQSIQWQLQAVIPVSLFVYSNVFNLEGERGSANFYKCGDLLSQPHFLSWKKIETEEPDFHQPAFFGAVEFEAKLV